MIVTNDFVFIGLPKTGTTFVREILGNIYEGKNSKYEVLQSFDLDQKYSFNSVKKKSFHSRCDQIPIEHKDKQIVSIIRNPFDLYISHYEFGAWKRQPPQPLKLLNQMYGNYFEMSFKNYVYMLNDRKILNSVYPPFNFLSEVGNLSHQLIQFYFTNPDSTLMLMDDKYFVKELYRNEMCSVHFLKTEHLNNDLFHFLEKYDYEPAELSNIKSHYKVNTSDKRFSKLHQYFDDELINYVMNKEKLFFQLFPEYIP